MPKVSLTREPKPGSFLGPPFDRQPDEQQSLNKLLSTMRSQRAPTVPMTDNQEKGAAKQASSTEARELDQRYAELGRPRREYGSDWEMAALQQQSSRPVEAETTAPIPDEEQSLDKLLSNLRSQCAPETRTAEEREREDAEWALHTEARKLDERYAELGRRRREYGSDWEMAALHQQSDKPIEAPEAITAPGPNTRQTNCGRPQRGTCGNDRASIALYQILVPEARKH